MPFLPPNQQHQSTEYKKTLNTFFMKDKTPVNVWDLPRIVEVFGNVPRNF